MYFCLNFKGQPSKHPDNIDNKPTIPPLKQVEYEMKLTVGEGDIGVNCTWYELDGHTDLIEKGGKKEEGNLTAQRRRLNRSIIRNGEY